MPECALHTIMLPVRGDGKGRNLLAHATVLAKRFGARVRIVHCHPTPDDIMPYYTVIPSVRRKQIEKAAGRNADVTREKLTTEFQMLAEEFGRKDAEPQPGSTTARFIEYDCIPSAIRHFEAQGSAVGDQLHAEARSAGADMLVMGAYHENYERDSIFGGNSQVVVAEAELLVGLVH